MPSWCIVARQNGRRSRRRCRGEGCFGSPSSWSPPSSPLARSGDGASTGPAVGPSCAPVAERPPPDEGASVDPRAGRRCRICQWTVVCVTRSVLHRCLLHWLQPCRDPCGWRWLSSGCPGDAEGPARAGRTGKGDYCTEYNPGATPVDSAGCLQVVLATPRAVRVYTKKNLSKDYGVEALG
jgi:hypothetical protein